ncbi:hypothetical protein [Streptomyces fagopyri]|uniref:hypothetical protein n=1 Tax=Streptomyces fagopyri TaxID=2662397 RepID=UPI0033E0DE17
MPLAALIGVRGSRLPPELCVAVTAGVIVAGLSHGTGIPSAASTSGAPSRRHRDPPPTSVEPTRRQPAVRITPRRLTSDPGPAKQPRLIEKRTHRAADRAEPGVPAQEAPTGPGHGGIAGPENSPRHRSGAAPQSFAQAGTDVGAAVRERTSAPAGRRPGAKR